MTGSTDREARLVPTLLNVLVAGMCDPHRLSRGRSYVRQGAVMDIHVAAGELTGFVQGGRPVPYEVTVRVDDAEQASSPTQLVPTAREVRFDCTCPDWEAPCKHGVAVMYEFADRVGRDPSLLATWRGAAKAGAAERATIGSRARGDRPVAAPKPQLDDEVREALRRFLGDDVEVARPDISPLTAPRSDGWDDAWAAMLDDALEHLRDHVGRP
jgi:uncharacterized Zn finger protein